MVSKQQADEYFQVGDRFYYYSIPSEGAYHKQLDSVRRLGQDSHFLQIALGKVSVEPKITESVQYLK